MAKLTGIIIDSTYKKIKNYASEDMHDKWSWKPMMTSSQCYAALDGYVSYELYNMLITIREALRLG
jgi:hypothetical protein